MQVHTRTQEEPVHVMLLVDTRARWKVECARCSTMSCRTVPYYTLYTAERRSGEREGIGGGKKRGPSARGFAPFASSAFFLPLFFPLSPPLSLLPWPRDVATKYRDDCFGSSTPRASNSSFNDRERNALHASSPLFPSIFSLNRIFFFFFYHFTSVYEQLRGRGATLRLG